MAEIEAEIETAKRFRNSQLDDQVRKDLEYKLLTDSEFKKEFDLNLALLDGIDIHFDQKLKERFRNEERVKVGRTLYFKPFLIAASVTLLIIFGYLLLNDFSSASPQELYAENFRPYYNVVESNHRGEVSAVKKAYQLYDQRKYSEAALAFETELAETPDEPALLFYGGLSYLAAGVTDKAIIKLKEVAGSENQFTQPAQWYLGLAFLKQEDLAPAIAAFETLATKEGAYRNRAARVLEELGTE